MTERKSPWRDMTPEQWDQASAAARLTAMTAARDVAVVEADRLRAALVHVTTRRHGNEVPCDSCREVRRLVHDSATSGTREGDMMYSGDEFYDDDVTSGPQERWAACNGCDGSGWDTEPAHAPGCTGECSGACPVPVQVQCPSCGGAGQVRVS